MSCYRTRRCALLLQVDATVRVWERHLPGGYWLEAGVTFRRSRRSLSGWRFHRSIRVSSLRHPMYNQAREMTRSLAQME